MGGDGCLPGVRRWATGSRTILALIAAHGFLLRLFSAVKHEVVLHEYDPYFNYQCAQFMVRHGVRRFWDSFDAGSWYPVGRRVGRTVYPGLMLAAYGAYQTLHYIGLDVDLKTVCVFLPPVLSVGTVYAVYLLAREIAGSECASLASAFFVGSLPALLPRTSAGAFDNESLAITLMVLSLYAWLRAVAGPSLLRSAAAAVATFLMALSWGGYVFVMNAVACFSLAAVVLRVDAERVSAVYVVYHPLAVALCYQVPMISNAIVGSLEMKFPHIVFAVSLLRLTASHAREQYRRVASGGEHRTDEALGSDRHGAPTVPIIQRLPPTLTVIGAPLVALLWLLMVERRSEGHSTLTGRLQSLFSPGKAKIGNPLVASISEHQPTRWTNMVLDFWVTLVYNPIGFYVCFKNGLRVGYLSLAIYGVVASYFAAAMVRLGLIFAPAAAILSGLGVTYTLENCVRAKKRSAAVIATIVTGVLLIGHVTHSTWVASTIYSNPNVVLSWHSQTGDRLVADDFRDAYSWIRHNTPRDAVIMAWWDYGYQLRQMANRAVLTDNNTSNYKQIALTGMIFASEEPHAHGVLKRLGVHYVMVVYGGVARYSADDVSKFGWMTRIAETEFPQVHHSRFAGEQGRRRWTRTLLHRLCYHGVSRVAGVDKVRQTEVEAEPIRLTHFTEVMTSENWIVRIYRVNDQEAVLAGD